jgi:hypothetical protein
MEFSVCTSQGGMSLAIFDMMDSGCRALRRAVAVK